MMVHMVKQEIAIAGLNRIGQRTYHVDGFQKFDFLEMQWCQQYLVN
jgi:hypothetical protein